MANATTQARKTRKAERLAALADEQAAVLDAMTTATAEEKKDLVHECNRIGAEMMRIESNGRKS